MTNFQENRCLATTPEVSLLKNLTVYFLLRLLQKFSIKSQLSSALIVFPLAGNRSDCYKMILCLEVKLYVKMRPNSAKKMYILCIMVSSEVSLPLENLPSHMLFLPNFLSHKIPLTVPVFVDPTKWWMVEEIILKSGEERHVDKYMVMNTTRNKISTKCCREVS